LGLVDVVDTTVVECGAHLVKCLGYSGHTLGVCGAYLVMGLVDVVDTPVEQFFRTKHLLILV
jgi:hypothetical protein